MEHGKVELYHGSGQIVEFPEIRKTKYTKDFSWGFYCTKSYEQAFAGQGVNMVRELLMYTLMWKMKNLT